MVEFVFDFLDYNLISNNFENKERFLNFLCRLEQLELKKVSKGILSNYTNRNWNSLLKDCTYLKDLSEFLHFTTVSHICEMLKNQLRLPNVKSRAVNTQIYELLLHLENLCIRIKDYLSSNLVDKHEFKKEDYELFSYSAIRFKDLKIIKTIPPSMKSNSPLDI